jgi:hypothetical protein
MAHFDVSAKNGRFTPPTVRRPALGCQPHAIRTLNILNGPAGGVAERDVDGAAMEEVRLLRNYDRLNNIPVPRNAILPP